MRSLRRFVVIAATLLLATAQLPAPTTLTVDGVARQAIIAAPEGKFEKHPLVFVFHGHGGNMRHSMRTFNVHGHWPEAVVVYPEGLPTPTTNDPRGERNGWQIAVGLQKDRDIKFFDALLADVKKKHSIDEKRIYVMGHSNGGRFSYVLWAERGRQIAGFGPSGSPAGLMTTRLLPRPAFLIAGRKDEIVSFAGQNATAERLRRLLEIDETKGKRVGPVLFEPGKGDLELATYFHDGGHEYPRDGAKLTVDFFKRHPLP